MMFVAKTRGNSNNSLAITIPFEVVEAMKLEDDKPYQFEIHVK